MIFAAEPGTWKLAISDVPAALTDDDGQLDPKTIDDVAIVLGYIIDE